MSCDFCEKDIPDGLTICPYCGRPQRTPAEWSRQRWAMLLVTVATVVILVVWHRLFRSG